MRGGDQRQVLLFAAPFNIYTYSHSYPQDSIFSPVISIIQPAGFSVYVVAHVKKAEPECT